MVGVIQQRKVKNIPPITVRGANLTDCRGEGIFISTEKKGRLAGQVMGVRALSGQSGLLSPASGSAPTH